MTRLLRCLVKVLQAGALVGRPGVAAEENVDCDCQRRPPNLRRRSEWRPGATVACRASTNSCMMPRVWSNPTNCSVLKSQ
eukprot:3655967-Pyramimonas_sp.AAC.1